MFLICCVVYYRFGHWSGHNVVGYYILRLNYLGRINLNVKRDEYYIRIIYFIDSFKFILNLTTYLYVCVC